MAISRHVAASQSRGILFGPACGQSWVMKAKEKTAAFSAFVEE